jgi:3-deoxy-D-arabino-heptulosonate 7-phosphate (DAHP) synthase
MIRKKEKTNLPIVIDLTGPDGNAFSLLAMARSIGKKLGMSYTEIENIIDDMMESDYENLIKVFDKHFGDFVILER